MSQGRQDCCLCKDAITTTVKYTECCTEPICDYCQADLLTSKIVSCLACNHTINPCSLVEPLTLLQQHFDQILKDTLDRLTDPIQVFTKAIADLTNQLNRHYDYIARLRQIMLKDNPSQLVVLDQEYTRVIKPLQTTILPANNKKV